MVKVKIDMEEIDIDTSTGDANALLSIALGVPVARDRMASRITVPYPVMTNFQTPAHEAWIRHLIKDTVQSHFEVRYCAKYQQTDIQRKRKDKAFYFDGSYISNSLCDDIGDYWVYAVAYNSDHKKRINKVSKKMGINVDKIFTVDYKNYYHPGYKVHGSEWIAAIIGAMYADVVYIPSTIEFWGEMSRTEKFYKDGSNWISRYYQRRVNLANPNKKSKTEMKEYLAQYPLCTCGKCIECYTSCLITEGETNIDDIPDNVKRMFRTAVKLGRADEYLPFV